MVEREIAETLLELAGQYPVVTITGPRQAGKTTLARSAFSRKVYISLEDIDVREKAKSDPRGLLNNLPDGAILDEIQRVPELLSYIQTFVDKREAEDRSGSKGLFILTGSHQLKLLDSVSQSLAGRTALLQLLPLSVGETIQVRKEITTENCILNGFYPRVYVDNLLPIDFYRSYYSTYVERDVRELINLKNVSSFNKFVKLCAGRIGQLFHFDQLATEVGVSQPTIKSWSSILETSFLIFFLQPYFENFNKRITKSSKLYFYDPGMACYLLGIENERQLSRDPARGRLFENLAIVEMMKARFNQGKDPNLYFFRDAHGREVDIVYKRANELVPVEIKSASTIRDEFFKNIHYFQSIACKRATKGFLVYNGKSEKGSSIPDKLNFLDSRKITEEI